MITRLKFDLTDIVDPMLNMLPEELFRSKTTTFLDVSMGGGQFVRVIEQKLREYGHSDENIKSRVFGMEENILRVKYAVHKHKLVGTYMKENFLTWESGMKFDCVLGNPPYQLKVGPKKTEPIWDKFVFKSFDHLKEGGYLALIHPSGWRNVEGRFSEVRDLLLSKQVEYLEIHNEKDGMQTFGASTRYDWYVLKNVDKEVGTTVVTFEDGVPEEIDLEELPFVPNHSYDTLKKLVAEPGEETVDVLYSRSAYGTDKENVNDTKTKKFKYPVVYHVSKQDGPVFKWSSRNDLGHFGIAKIIWGNSAGTGFHLDLSGELGLTQFAYAIADTPNNLKAIYNVLTNNYELFSGMTNVVGSGINRKVLATFRKDFWKEFV
jgi:hypothetical protein